MKYLKSITILALAILFTPFNGATQEADFEEVSPIRAKLLVRNGSLMVDVRQPEEIAAYAYDVDNIINIPLGEIESRFNEIPTDRQLIIACKSGNRSRQAAAILIKNGYNNLVNLNGGMLSWEDQGLEVIIKGKSTKTACCADPTSKKCNPDGTCKTPPVVPADE